MFSAARIAFILATCDAQKVVCVCDVFWSSDSLAGLFIIAIEKVVEQITLLGVGNSDA